MGQSNRPTRTKKSYFLPVTAALIVFAFLPNNADPLNPIKFWILGIAAIYCISVLASEIRNIQLKLVLGLTSKYFTALVFAGALIFAFIFTDVKTIGLVGYTGRNNGLLFYLFLIVIFIYIVKNIEFQGIQPLYVTIAVACFALDIYGTLQHFNLDFEKWKNPYSPVILFIGNPDFAASLLGIFTVVLCALLFADLSRVYKLFIAIIIAFTLPIIYWTHAKQGLLGTALGVGLLLVGFLWQRSVKTALVLLSIELLLGLFAIFGTLQIGPLSRYLYKGSINDRGYDWRAAWHMFTSHPWFGVGIDRYGGNFFKYRDAKYPLIYGYQQSVNNSHNIFLEFLATGGIFVGLAYTLFIIFIGWRAYRFWQNCHANNQILALGLISGWIVYVAQSFISVDNICVSIWGWLLSGVIVGLSFDKGSAVAGEVKAQRYRPRNVRRRRILIPAAMAIFVGPIFLYMYQGESRMHTFQRFPAPTNPSQQIIYNQIASRAFNTPLLSPDYKLLIAFNVTNAGDLDRGTHLFKLILNQDPRSFDANSFLAVIYEHNKDFENAIKHRIANKALNPFGADNLLQLEKDYIQVGNLSEAHSIESEISLMAPNSPIAVAAKKELDK